MHSTNIENYIFKDEQKTCYSKSFSYFKKNILKKYFLVITKLIK